MNKEVSALPRKPYMVYYLGRERANVRLPSLINKYEVQYIVNPKEAKTWRLQGRKGLLASQEEHAKLRKKWQKGAIHND
jgi:hypothetical protein